MAVRRISGEGGHKMINYKNFSNEQLAEMYHSGDRKALDALIENNTRFLKHIFERFEREMSSFIQYYDVKENNGTLHCQDIFQSAQIGLAKTIINGSYDSSKGKVLTYAAPFIEGEIKRYIAENSTGYTMKKTRFYKIMDSDDSSETAPFYRIPIVDESENDEYESPVLSEETLVGNLISADKAAYNRIMQEWISDLCRELPLLERKVLIYSYGLFDKPQLTRAEIAYWLGKTEKTISAMLRRAEIKVIAKGVSSGMVEFRRLWRKVDRECRRRYSRAELEQVIARRLEQIPKIDVKARLRVLAEFVEFAVIVEIILKAKKREE